MKENKFNNRAKRIIEDGKVNINTVLYKFNNFLDNKIAALQMTLCFYPDSNVRFISTQSGDMFNTNDIWFNGDISIGLNGSITVETIKWDLLETILTEGVRRRELLKNKVVGKMLSFPFNMTVRDYLLKNFVEHVISATAELEEYGNTHTGALFKEFLDDGSEAKIDFFNELGKMYKGKVYAEL